MTEPRDILTTIRPADRIPSHGRQLTVDGTPGPSAEHSPLCRARRGACEPRPCRRCGRENGCNLTPCCACMAAEPIAHPIMRPQPLNLWDQSADSLPETWSTPR